MIGETLGRYRLDSLLGEGGMGKVYKAFDESLGRLAAVKILPAEVAQDAERLERFTREARTASAMSHPNVVTIYEVGAVAGQHFIAMELVDGENLRERLLRGRLELPRALELVAQIADGVATAHAAGVIHRDLKPENVVIARNGFAKILDFGLAKLRSLPAGTDETATAVRRTTPGMILGTVGYMSPEQARGEDVDHRGDIFAIGCILYEAIAGTRAFRGDSSVDTLHRILYSEPAALTEAAPETPSEVQRIVRKCLAKDPELRYQSAKDIALDLRDARRELQSQPAAGTRPTTVLRPAPFKNVAAASALLAIGAIAAYLFAGRDRARTVATAPHMSITRLTASGNVIGAAISPDGNYLAYAHSDAARHSLWVRQIATASALQLIPPTRGGFWGVSFSPDSRSIYYSFKSQEDPAGALFQMPILGGQPRRLAERIDSHVHFSADGSRMLFLRMHEPSPGHSAVIVANADGTNQRVLLSKAPPESLQLFWGAPDWAPDGRSIVVPVRNGKRWSLMEADATTGALKPFSRDEWTSLGDVQWLADGTGVLVAGGDGSSSQIWLVRRDGPRRKITSDLSFYRIVSLTSDDKQLVTVPSDVTSSIWKVPVDEDTPPARLTNTRYDGYRGVAAASDGTIYFTSTDSGRQDIWSVDERGERRQVSSGEWPSQFVAISPDQKYLITTMARQRDWVLVRLNRDGSGMKVLCPVVAVSTGRMGISFTPDSRTVVFDSSIDGNPRIYRVPIDGGAPVPIARGDSPTMSPDGSMIAVLGPDRIAVISADGSKLLHALPNVGTTNSSMLRWSADSKGIFHNAGTNDRINIWYQPLDGSQPRKVTAFDDELVHQFDLTPDGKALVIARGVLSRDAVLLSYFR